MFMGHKPLVHEWAQKLPHQKLQFFSMIWDHKGSRNVSLFWLFILESPSLQTQTQQKATQYHITTWRIKSTICL